jgi:hypothetical protein
MPSSSDVQQIEDQRRAISAFDLAPSATEWNPEVVQAELAVSLLDKTLPRPRDIMLGRS